MNEQKKPFEQKALISYYRTNHRLELTQHSLFELLQDIAIHHSDSLGYTLDYLSEMGKGWVLTNWHIEIENFPRCGEEIRIQTWSSSCRRLQAERSFNILDEAGELLIKGTSRWIFMDLNRRRPTPIPPEMEQRYYSGLDGAIPGEKFHMEKSPEGKLVKESRFRVRRSETDTNGHTNNTSYVAWAMDSVPDEIYDGRRNVDIRVVYRKECYRNSLVLAKTYVEERAGITIIDTHFYDGENPETLFCQVITYWR